MAFKIAYYLSLFFAAVCSIYRFKKLDRGPRILSILTCCAFANECAAFYFGRKYHNNLPLYSIYCLVEFFILCLYFNYIIDVFKKKNIGLYIGLSGVSLGLLDIFFVQHLNAFNSYFLYFEDLSVIGMSLFAFFRLLLTKDELHLYRYAPFWFTSILIFFWSITFLTWGLYDYINIRIKHEAWKINSSLMMAGTITYGCFGIAFLLYPKMKTINE